MRPVAAAAAGVSGVVKPAVDETVEVNDGGGEGEASREMPPVEDGGNAACGGNGVVADA